MNFGKTWKSGPPPSSHISLHLYLWIVDFCIFGADLWSFFTFLCFFYTSLITKIFANKEIFYIYSWTFNTIISFVVDILEQFSYILDLLPHVRIKKVLSSEEQKISWVPAGADDDGAGDGVPLLELPSSGPQLGGGDPALHSREVLQTWAGLPYLQDYVSPWLHCEVSCHSQQLHQLHHLLHGGLTVQTQTLNNPQQCEHTFKKVFANHQTKNCKPRGWRRTDWSYHIEFFKEKQVRLGGYEHKKDKLCVWANIGLLPSSVPVQYQLSPIWTETCILITVRPTPPHPGKYI